MSKSAMPQSQTTLFKSEGSIAPEDASKNLVEFCRIASFELASTLATIVGELEHGMALTDPSLQQRTMGLALEASERALRLARNLKFFSTEALSPAEETDLSQTAQDALDIVRKELKHHRIHVQMENLSHPTRVVSKEALKQAMVNLLLRSAETMPQGGTIVLTVGGNAPGDIRIEGSGVGISQESLSQVFAPAGTLTRSDIPTLELALARGLLEAIGGLLQVETGTHTVFSVHFPGVQGTATKASRPAQRTQREQRRSQRVLSNLPLEASFQQGKPFAGTLHHLSRHGCSVWVEAARRRDLPALEATGTLTLFLFQDQVIRLTHCRVASLTPQGDLISVGIEFLKLSSDEEKELTSLSPNLSF